MEYFSQTVQPKVAKLIADMITLTSPKESLSNAYIIESIIADDIVLLLKRKGEEFSLGEYLNFMLLFANLCALSSVIRDKIVQIGGGELLVRKGEEMVRQRYVG